MVRGLPLEGLTGLEPSSRASDLGFSFGVAFLLVVSPLLSPDPRLPFSALLYLAGTGLEISVFVTMGFATF